MNRAAYRQRWARRRPPAFDAGAYVDRIMDEAAMWSRAIGFGMAIGASFGLGRKNRVNRLWTRQ